MRVLWFSNNTVVESHKGIGCSWIGSLEMELSKRADIELAISFNSNELMPTFVKGKTKYYPIAIKGKRNKIGKLIKRWSHKITNENEINNYINVINEFKPDLIHIFGTESDFGLIIPKITIPCIIHLQGNLTVITQKWYNNLTYIDIIKYTNKWLLLKGYGIYHEYFTNKKASIREVKIYTYCKNFMGRTDWDRRLTSVLAPQAKYYHCDEIMRSKFYLNEWKRRQNDPIVIISTIRSNIYKGLETIFECTKILKNNYPDIKIIWQIAGIAMQDEIVYIIERKYKVKLKNYGVKLLGPLNEDQLISNMLKSDLFVHPSHIENSPNSICEAMLLGMPVIATFAGGTSSIITNKRDGILIQDGDPFSMVGVIIELLTKPSLSEEIGRNARNTAFQRNDPNKIVEDLIKIYKSVLPTLTQLL